MSGENTVTRLRATLRNSLAWGVAWGTFGSVVATAFFAFISVAYRGKRLSEINWLRCGVGGAVVAGLFVPTFLQTMNLLSGGGLVPWHLVLDDSVYSALFGGITAAGTMILAQRDEAAHPVTVQQLLDRMERESLGAASATGYRRAERSRSAERP